MHILSHFIYLAIFGQLTVVSAQTIPVQPMTPTMGIRNLLSIRLNDPIIQPPGKVMLKWDLASSRRGGYCNVEKASYKEGPYEVIAVLKQDSVQNNYVDEQAAKGSNFYRLRWVLEDGTQFLSNNVEAQLAGDMSCKFYPNPVDNMLIVRSEQPLDLILTDGNGKLRLTVKLQAGLQTVDVSHLDKGMYIITLTQAESGRKRTEKLIKN